jgi:hypothetical protein
MSKVGGCVVVAASGPGPQRWSAEGLVDIDEHTGVSIIDTSTAGEVDVVVRVANDHGADEQSWVLSIGGGAAPGPDDGDGDPAGDGDARPQRGADAGGGAHVAPRPARRLRRGPG